MRLNKEIRNISDNIDVIDNSKIICTINNIDFTVEKTNKIYCISTDRSKLYVSTLAEVAIALDGMYDDINNSKDKQTHEKSKKEYLDDIFTTLEGEQKRRWEEQICNDKVYDFSYLSKCIAIHKVSIINAIWEGKQVPENVLNDYPDIKEDFKKEISENIRKVS